MQYEPYDKPMVCMTVGQLIACELPRGTPLTDVYPVNKALQCSTVTMIWLVAQENGRGKKEMKARKGTWWKQSKTENGT